MNYTTIIGLKTWANYLSKGYFGRAWVGGAAYLAINISRFNLMKIRAVKQVGPSLTISLFFFH